MHPIGDQAVITDYNLCVGGAAELSTIYIRVLSNKYIFGAGQGTIFPNRTALVMHAPCVSPMHIVQFRTAETMREAAYQPGIDPL